MNIQPTLENDLVLLKPLMPEDFEILFEIAKDPLIWEQHPNKNRYKREIFSTFFEGAIESGGAFLIFDKQLSIPIGSTRFYDYDETKSQVLIGYTFFARDYWGGKYNHQTKNLMLNHAFNYVDKVHFHIGAFNIRSQKSIEKLGAIKIDEMDVTYHGETNTLNFIYQITKEQWSIHSRVNY